jgi:hypothetical protein
MSDFSKAGAVYMRHKIIDMLLMYGAADGNSRMAQ